METYISILRGINVSGHKVIQMASLKAMFEKLKFEEVITYIQSGNVVFKADKKSSAEELSKKIAAQILKEYKFEVPVIVRKSSEIDSVLATNPFIKEKGIDVEKLHVTFLAEIPGKANLEAVSKYDYSPDRFTIIGKEVFLYCPGGYGNTKLSNTFFENKLKILATTRNWKTVNKLAELAKNK
jgi:uncharacterized protein (DUF1697 family)